MESLRHAGVQVGAQRDPSLQSSTWPIAEMPLASWAWQGYVAFPSSLAVTVFPGLTVRPGSGACAVSTPGAQEEPGHRAC